MKSGMTYQGAVVPMVTPITSKGGLDEDALDRLIEVLLAGGVEGLFVLGTTGEGAHVPRPLRKRLVSRTVNRVNQRALVCAGMGDVQPGDIDLANDFLRAGADAVVVHPPISRPVPAAGLGRWYRGLLDQLNGPLILYNMPSITGVSIPLDAIESLIGHPNLAGIKDSENDTRRLEELLRRFGNRHGFSIFVGVGALMEKGLKLGAHGIVPSVGNLIPDVCQDLCVSAREGDWVRAAGHFSRMKAVAALYQRGRTLNESLSVLKAAVHFRGLCQPYVLPPLSTLSPAAMEKLRTQMSQLQLNGQ
ncbi:MAG TPA: dihydrodipicolinate synthase family protein [Verrucomicrobia bacterium]|mgnify:CR=1 FL=1|nr:dihydrodipicolinate synthase family protein [Verrucomicrobiota bacterium]HOP98567.1 dihydrodipicolinate synthase family protein [Verrucomicrobiota bacterium]